jgi:hypothetical protein
MKPGKLNFLKPFGPLQACNGTALPLPLPYIILLSHLLKICYKAARAGTGRSEKQRGIMSLLCSCNWRQSNVITQKQESCHFYVLAISVRAMSLLRNRNHVTSMFLQLVSEQCHYSETEVMTFLVLGHFSAFRLQLSKLFLYNNCNPISTSPFLLCSTQEVFVMQTFQINTILINYHKVHLWPIFIQSWDNNH